MDSRSAPLVLASASPRRLDLLTRIGLRPEVRPAHVDETPQAGEPAEVYVERLAGEKARAVARPGEVVLAADTTVVVDGRLLGKPESDEDARAMLAALSGREHSVLTGVALLATDGDRLASALSSTRVRMRALSPGWISWYVATGEPADKAGGYAIQGLGALLVASIEGDYETVVGLPLALLPGLFERLGLDLLDRL
ncbi:MAG: Maf family protein [Thermoanaerobaculia bacterium]